MIPKIIHYCWFGGNPLPEDARKCINSWRKFCPEYEIKEWNESNFDVNSCTYAREAYEAKKWAFVSDYARFWILYNYGGVYFDTDVELIKSIDDIVQIGPFMGKEPYGDRCRVAAGLGLAAEKNNQLYSEILEYYSKLKFVLPNGTYNDETIVTYITMIMEHRGYIGHNKIERIENINVYPPDFFCPMDMDSENVTITQNTRSIHWYSASWKDEKESEIHKRAIAFYKRMPNKFGRRISAIYENVAKFTYYTKKEGVKSTVFRIKRKFNKIKRIGGRT